MSYAHNHFTIKKNHTANQLECSEYDHYKQVYLLQVFCLNCTSFFKIQFRKLFQITIKLEIHLVLPTCKVSSIKPVQIQKILFYNFENCTSNPIFPHL